MISFMAAAVGGLPSTGSEAAAQPVNANHGAEELDLVYDNSFNNTLEEPKLAAKKHCSWLSSLNKFHCPHEDDIGNPTKVNMPLWARLLIVVVVLAILGILACLYYKHIRNQSDDDDTNKDDNKELEALQDAATLDKKDGM